MLDFNRKKEPKKIFCSSEEVFIVLDSEKSIRES